MEALINLIKNCMEHSKPDGVVHCDYSGNPLYAEIRYGTTERALTQRTYPIFLTVFTEGGVQSRVESVSAWLLPVLFLNCRWNHNRL